MGVCTEERSVMHWQSARYLDTTREQNSPIEAHSGSHCSDSSYNHLLHRSCTSCIKGSKNCLKNDDQHLNDPSGGRSFDRSDRRMFDESSMNYSDGSRNDCYELGDSIKHADTALLFKSEPCGPPSSPESSCEAMTPSGPDGCAGCGQIIQDRFYLSAVEKRWHATCLQCCVCRQTLDRETSCFARDENIYCKSDYYRVFGTKRCSRCLASISPSELVMRARNLVFHVNCFSCAVCHLPLTKGDQFGVRDSIIYCRLHFGMSIEIQITPSTSLPNSSYNTSFSPSQNTLMSSMEAKKMSPNDFCVPSAHVISGMQQPPRQKGRPRKRKPKDIDALTANIDLTTEYLDFSRGGHLGSSSRTKRMRTSFKHHQLRTMKSYFSVNHNPDAKDLKQLSQKTGLPKRVLQVWFQNARAKWRRMMMKQDGKGMIDRGDGSLDLDSFSAHSPSSFILGGPPSPHSLD